MANKPLLIHYAEIKTQVSKYEAELKMLKPQVQAEVEALIGDTEQKLGMPELNGATFSLAKAKPKWEYSQSTQLMIQTVEELKEKEQQTGDATNLKDGERELRFNPVKD